MSCRIALISCVKSKLPTAAPARDLYTSSLFQKMRAYAEANADRWYILSAEHGLLSPDTVIEPYERTLNRMRQHDRLKWAGRVQEQLVNVLPKECEVLIIAGRRYHENISPFLRERGYKVLLPFEGLSMGRLLRALSAASLNDV